MEDEADYEANNEFFSEVSCVPYFEELDPEEKVRKEQLKQDALLGKEPSCSEEQPPPVSASIVIPFLGHALTPEEKKMPQWQGIIQRNFDASRVQILKYLRQVFQANNFTNMGRHRKEAGVHYKDATLRR